MSVEKVHKNPTEKIKLYSVYTDETEALKSIFLKSVKDDWEINIGYWGKAGEGRGDFRSPGWYKIVKKKIEFLIDKVRENWENVIIWSDIDLQFFGNSSDLINRAIVDKDMLFLSEHWPEKEINSGFFVMRCNSKTLSFLELVLRAKIEDLDFGDQSAINDILKYNEIGVKWDILPSQFWAQSHSPNPPLDVILHHANCTAPQMRDGKKVGSTELKIEQLKRIRRHVVLHRRWRWLFNIKNVIGPNASEN